tara:strand:- start:72 stop:620 length:549 start_codon:yes stop_codon:yes gene_type:complete
MLCNLDDLLNGCIRLRQRKYSQRVVILIEGFPRPNHPILEFAKLIYLLRVYGAKATFVVDWCEIRERGLTSSATEMMKLLCHNEHEIAIKFKPNFCGGYNLRQHAVEALHFIQRVYNITIVSAKVGYSMSDDATALESLGISIIDSVPNQRIVNDDEDLLANLAIVLEDVGDKECVTASQMY